MQVIDFSYAAEGYAVRENRGFTKIYGEILVRRYKKIEINAKVQTEIDNRILKKIDGEISLKIYRNGFRWIDEGSAGKENIRLTKVHGKICS